MKTILVILCAIGFLIIFPSFHLLCDKIHDKEKEINILAHDLDVAETKICNLHFDVSRLKVLCSDLKTRIESLEKDNDWYKKERSISD